MGWNHSNVGWASGQSGGGGGAATQLADGCVALGGVDLGAGTVVLGATTLTGVIDGRASSTSRLMLPVGSAAAPPLAIGADGDDGFYAASDELHRAREGVADGRVGGIFHEVQSGLVAGSTIAVNSWASRLYIEIQSAAGVTFTSTPQIADGKFNGQRLLLFNGNAANGFTFADESATPGANTRLISGTAKTLTAGDTMPLEWDAADSEWKQVGAVAVL